MKFRLKDNPIDVTSNTFLEDYFRNQGIYKLSSFLKGPSKEDEESPTGLNYLKEGITLLHKHLEKGSSIFLQVDSDSDGYTSSAILYSFIKDICPDIDIQWAIHPGKEHGMVPDLVPFDVDLVLIPDAGSNQVEESQELSKRADILIIDHHLTDVNINTDNVIVINNQTSPFFNNKSLSGAGMVYKFIQAYCKEFDLGDLYENYVDLAAIGIVADMMDSRQLDNNYIITQGLNNIQNKMILALIERRAFSISDVDSPNKIDIAFYVAPIINGLIRYGTQEEKENLFAGLIDNYITDEFEYTSRGKTTIETYYQKVARESASVKAKQDDAVNKIVPMIINYIDSQGLDKHQIIIYKTSKTNPNEVPSTITGLVAMKLVAHYKKPSLVLRPVFMGKDVSFRGSGRALAADGFNSFKDYLNSTGLVEYAQGHHLAHGVGIKESLIDDLLKQADIDLADVDFGTRTVEVDAIFKQGTIRSDLLMSFAKLKHLYGNGISEPLFAFELFITENHFAAMGKTKNTVKLVQSGVDFIKFRDSNLAENFERMLKTGPVNVVLLGKPGLSEYNGNVKLQINIEDIVLTPRTLGVLF